MNTEYNQKFRARFPQQLHIDSLSLSLPALTYYCNTDCISTKSGFRIVAVFALEINLSFVLFPIGMHTHTHETNGNGHRQTHSPEHLVFRCTRQIVAERCCRCCPYVVISFCSEIQYITNLQLPPNPTQKWQTYAPHINASASIELTLSF